MATSPLPSSPSAASSATQTAPPNFYAQAASAQPTAAVSKPNTEDTAKFKTIMPKLLDFFDKLEKLKPNGVDISKKIKAVAQSLKDLKSEVFEGDEGDDSADTDLGPGGGAGGAGATGQTNAASPPPTTPGGVAGTGA